MSCNANNPCAGYYGKCLDVKITNKCNGKCSFCIEKGGLITESVPVEELIAGTNILKEYQKVLILGGEPFLYPHLEDYIEGIKDKQEIYITTNGSLFGIRDIKRMAKHLTAVNISIHHFSEAINSDIVGTSVSFNDISQAVSIFKKYGVGIRINTNLVKRGIDSYGKTKIMVKLAHDLGADGIRFAELQNCPGMYVAAEHIFGDDIHRNPYCEGCEQTLKSDYCDVDVKLRLTCGIVNPVKDIPQPIEENKSETKVMYPNSKVASGWVEDTHSCHGRIDSSSGCHGRGHY